MYRIVPDEGIGKHSFDRVADVFLRDQGLPFAQVLSARDIEQAFTENGALFGQEDIFSTQIVLWAFLAQVLRDGKGAACAAAVADIATYMQQTGGAVPSGDTGDYCRARAKLDRSTMRRLARRAGRQLDERVPAEWLWHGLRARLVDGFTFTMMDTPENQRAYPKEDIAELYGYRWNAELDIRDIKQTLGLDHVRCKTPEMVERQLWTTLLAYNLIRKVMATAAALHGKQPRQLGFTLACQTILSSWMLLATGSCRNAQELRRSALGRIAANEVADRPGRIEPRVIKRRRHRYPLMTRPRQELRQDLCAT